MTHKPISHQTQVTTYGCVSACLSMILDMDVNVVTDEFHSSFMAREIEPEDYLKKHGCLSKFGARSGHVQAGAIYLLRVPSLNSEGMFHAVVLDTRFEDIKLYDPAGHSSKRYGLGGEGDCELSSWIIDLEILIAPRLGLKTTPLQVHG